MAQGMILYWQTLLCPPEKKIQSEVFTILMEKVWWSSLPVHRPQAGSKLTDSLNFSSVTQW